jgi:subtilisin family serine protease
MDDRDYIVLELAQPRANGDLSFRTLERSAAPPEATVKVESLSAGDVEDARQTPGVVVAPPLPIALIEPLDEHDPSEPLAAGPTWGVVAVGASASPFSGSGVKVAVLDTGIDKDHPAFAGVNITEKDFTGEGDGDTNGHGTHCAGTILGRDVDGVRFGVAQGVDELLVGKVLGAQGGSTTDITSAMLWAVENGANVLSMSLGIDFPGIVDRLVASGMNVNPATSRALEGYRDNINLFGKVAALIAAGASFDRPAVVVAATGNESERDAPQPYTIDVAPPAASEGFLRVAALKEVTPSFEVASFSNTAPTLAAPGVGIVSAKTGGGLTSKSGTSMATPHVAGVAALWAEKLMAGGALDPTELAAELVANSRAIPGLTKPDGGAGLVQAPA